MSKMIRTRVGDLVVTVTPSPQPNISLWSVVHDSHCLHHGFACPHQALVTAMRRARGHR